MIKLFCCISAVLITFGYKGKKSFVKQLAVFLLVNFGFCGIILIVSGISVNNITVTQVNVKSAESQIRDVDFAAESANYSKANILAQSGSYAMAQANASQQNVLRLLQ